MEWISVKKRLPEIEGEYLCWFDIDECYLLMRYSKKLIDDSHWISDGFVDFPTHWMPLPEPPKQ